MKNKWTYIVNEHSIADTGDYTSSIQFTNSIDILQTSSEEIETEDCEKFCQLLDLMPDLWSHNMDAIQFELNQMKKSEYIDDITVTKIKSRLQRVHGHYFKDKSLSYNILNFISCSAWNHRWGRKYAQDNTIEIFLKKQLNEVFGRCKNLLSRNLKLKDDLSSLKKENNRLKQLLTSKIK